LLPWKRNKYYTLYVCYSVHSRLYLL
jgi:hypothetical protein